MSRIRAVAARAALAPAQVSTDLVAVLGGFAGRVHDAAGADGMGIVAGVRAATTLLHAAVRVRAAACRAPGGEARPFGPDRQLYRWPAHSARVPRTISLPVPDRRMGRGHRGIPPVRRLRGDEVRPPLSVE